MPPPADDDALPAEGYEQARAELADIVGRLEAGSLSLEDALALWERGEMLAAYCAAWLTDAQGRVEAVTQQDSEAPSD